MYALQNEKFITALAQPSILRAGGGRIFSLKISHIYIYGFFIFYFINFSRFLNENIAKFRNVLFKKFPLLYLLNC